MCLLRKGCLVGIDDLKFCFMTSIYQGTIAVKRYDMRRGNLVKRTGQYLLLVAPVILVRT